MRGVEVVYGGLSANRIPGNSLTNQVAMQDYSLDILVLLRVISQEGQAALYSNRLPFGLMN